MTPAQSRAARALVGWTQPQLSAASRVSVSTIMDFERGKRQTTAANLTALRTALESAGVTFLADGEMVEGGVGVRLKRSVAPMPSHPSPDSEAGIIETNEM
jgi:transcriptional regulator with XRE-family HTH domain